MHVNNEIGVINDIAAIGELCRSRKILLHVDAAQSVGKIPVDVEAMKIDLLSCPPTRSMAPRASARSMCAASRGCVWKPRCMAVAMSAACAPAPWPTHQIVGMGEAFRIAKEEMGAKPAHHGPA
jgi:cysteine desulfurase